MAITRQRQPVPPQSAPLGAGPVPITQPAPRRARRPLLAVAGVAVAAVGALGAYTMVNQAGDRVAVLAVAHTVPKGQVVRASDLTTAQVAPDPALKTVAVSRSSTIVGKTATTDLSVGALVTPGSVSAGTDVTAGKSVVGVLAKPGMIPAGRLQPGQAVSVVQTPGQISQGGKTTPVPLTVPAVVVLVGAPDSNGNVVVDLAADPADAPQIAAWAATGQVAIVTQPGAH